MNLLFARYLHLFFPYFIWFFDNFCKKDSSFLQCGFNPLSFSHLLQWAKATLEENAKIVKEPFILPQIGG